MSYNNEASVKELIRNALKEDIGNFDITTAAFIPAKKNVRAAIIAKEGCVVCGLAIASLVFKTLDRNIKFRLKARDGDCVRKGSVLAIVSGQARAILSAERVALNFLSHLSGVATKTRKFVNKLRPYRAKILDTRKTTPALRLLEKYAVRQGGGFNHRLRLDEMIMLKDNHLKVLGGYQNLKKLSSRYKTEIEVENLRDFAVALNLRPDVIMLDNMGSSDMKRAVMLKGKTQSAKRKILLEASGGITLKNIRKIAACGVDMISIGELTHSVEAIDISLEIL